MDAPSIQIASEWRFGIRSGIRLPVGGVSVINSKVFGLPVGGVSWTFRVSRLPVSGVLGQICNDIASGWRFGGHVYHHIVVELRSDILIKSHCATLHPLIHEQQYSFPTSKSYGLGSILFAECTTTWSTCFLQI